MSTMRARGKDGRWLGGRSMLGVWLVGLLLGGGQAEAGATVVWQWDGGSEDPGFGYAVAGVGDVDGDGIPDVVVTTPAARSGAGSVSVFSGASGQRLWRVGGETAGEQLGYAVAGVGDVNGDGVPDVIAGAPDAAPGGRVDAGRVYVLSGKDGQVLWRVEGEAAGDSLGLSVAGVGDVNGDGVPDVVVGAPLASPGGRRAAGRAYVLSGVDGQRLWRVDGEHESIELGYGVAGVGDVNGDGVPDVVVSVAVTSPGRFGAAGSVYALSGVDGRLLWRFDGDHESAVLRMAVVGAGDINGDGVPDVIASARSGGYIVVLSGVDGSELRRFEWDAVEIGPSVAGPGDVDGDGVPDILVGMDFADPEGRGIAGSAIVWSGADSRLLWRVDGEESGDQLGYAVAGVGDVDGDGRADIVVGAPYASRPGHLGEAYLVRFTGEPSPAGVPDISLTRDRLDFGTVRLDRSTPERGFTIRNNGGVPLTITALGPPRPPFYLDNFTPRRPFTIPPGHMEVIYVAFSPGRPGRFEQELLVRSTDPDSPVVAVTLTGQARKKRSR